MLRIYGTLRCPDCVSCLKDLDQAGTAYEFRDFDQDLWALKEFLKIRDGNSLFDTVRETGSIGIPCLVTEAGAVSLSWEEFM